MSSSDAPVHYWCHQCRRLFHIGPQIECPHCHGGFIEEQHTSRLVPVSFLARQTRQRSQGLSACPCQTEILSTDTPGASEERQEEFPGTLPEENPGSTPGAPPGPAPEGEPGLVRGDWSRVQVSAGSFLRSIHTIMAHMRRDRQSTAPAAVGVPAVSSEPSLRARVEVYVDDGSGPRILEGDMDPGMGNILQALLLRGSNSRVSRRTSKAALQSLPVVTVTPEMISAFAPQCTICQDDLETGTQALTLPCTHMYHPDCIHPWLAAHHTCPVCRHELPYEDHVIRNPNPNPDPLVPPNLSPDSSVDAHLDPPNPSGPPPAVHQNPIFSSGAVGQVAIGIRARQLSRVPGGGAAPGLGLVLGSNSWASNRRVEVGVEPLASHPTRRRSRRLMDREEMASSMSATGGAPARRQRQQEVLSHSWRQMGTPQETSRVEPLGIDPVTGIDLTLRLTPTAPPEADTAVGSMPGGWSWYLSPVQTSQGSGEGTGEQLARGQTRFQMLVGAPVLTSSLMALFPNAENGLFHSGRSTPLGPRRISLRQRRHQNRGTRTEMESDPGLGPGVRGVEDSMEVESGSGGEGEGDL